jgi:hypothetical protein
MFRDQRSGLFGSWALGVGSLLLLASIAGLAQAPAPAAPAVRFAGTWVGTQAWAIKDPPPGASNDQPVTLELAVVDGKVTGTMSPFLGGDDGATITEATIVGDELRATAVVGRPRPAGRRPSTGAQGAPSGVEGRGGGPAGGNSAISIAFVFRNDGVKMTGTADVKMGDVPWTKFRYSLGKKRSRY